MSDPAAGASCRTAVATVRLQWDVAETAAASGAVVRLRFPASVDLPADSATRSARARVENRTGLEGGLFDAIRNRGVDDDGSELLSVGLVSGGIRPGDFARVEFDCREGAAAPVAADFSCVPDVAGERGPVQASCAIALTLR